MIYFETPADAAAYIAGMSYDAFVEREELIERDENELYWMGEPHLEPEDRVLVSEDDLVLVTQQDRDDLQWVLDWEEYHL